MNQSQINQNNNSQPEGYPVLKEHVIYFFTACILYAILFAIAFYRNYLGITFPIITMATIVLCLLFLKKAQIPVKKRSLTYAAAAMLLGISNFLTANSIIVFFNTIGILILLTVFMLGQLYDDRQWTPGRYICNILFFYLCMIPELAAPCIHAGNYIRKIRMKNQEETNKTVKYIICGILLGIPMVCFAVWMLSSADAIFSDYVGKVFQSFLSKIADTPNIFLILFLLILGFFGMYTFLSALTLNNMPRETTDREKRNPIVAITFLLMVTAVYLVFCGIQVIFLFTGGAVLPEGYTYAEYARQGFFQLLFVCVFNFVLVTVCVSMFQKNKYLWMILLIFSGCTYVMIASSALRMLLYISVYHLTFLRVLVLWFLAMLAVLMAGVVAQIFKPDFAMFPYSMAVVTGFYLVFSFAKPDYWIARYNVAHMENEISVQDMWYLTCLSPDAAPVLKDISQKHCHEPEQKESEQYKSEQYKSEQNELEQGYYDEDSAELLYGEGSVGEYIPNCAACQLESYFHNIQNSCGKMGVRGFHLSKYQALKAAEEYFLEE